MSSLLLWLIAIEEENHRRGDNIDEDIEVIGIGLVVGIIVGFVANILMYIFLFKQ